MEWRARWQITIRWDRAENSPVGATVVERVVDSPADLRRLVEQARADPNVVAFPYRPVRQLVGDEPAECRNGHGYGGGSATQPVRGWWACSYGGHLVIRCRTCGDLRAEPAVGLGCDTREGRGTASPCPAPSAPHTLC